MSIEQLTLIIYDTYQMDLWTPNPVFKKSTFVRNSYSQWAINEFRAYLVRTLYPRTEGTIDEFIAIAGEFVDKMKHFSEINFANKIMFSIARDMVSDIQDMLCAMK